MAIAIVGRAITIEREMKQKMILKIKHIRSRAITLQGAIEQSLI